MPRPPSDRCLQGPLRNLALSGVGSHLQGDVSGVCALLEDGEVQGGGMPSPQDPHDPFLAQGVPLRGS